MAVRDALEKRIDTVLRPLLQADGGDLELVSCTEDRVVVRLFKDAAFGVGAEYVREGILRPALEELIGDAELVFEKRPNRPRASDPGDAPG